MNRIYYNEKGPILSVLELHACFAIQDRLGSSQQLRNVFPGPLEHWTSGTLGTTGRHAGMLQIQIQIQAISLAGSSQVHLCL